MNKYSVKRADISLFIIELGFALKMITILTFDSANIVCDLLFYFCFFIALLNLAKYKYNQLSFFVLAVLYSFIYFSSARRNLFLLFVICTFILVSCSFRNSLKTTFFTAFAAFLIINVIAAVGAASNLYFKDFDGSLYYTFGFKNPNTFAMFFFSSMICFLLLFRKQFGKIIDLIFIVLSTVIFVVTGCKTLIICTVLLYFSNFLIKHIHFKIVKFFCIVFPVLVTLLLSFLALHVKKFLFIDLFLTGRLSLYNSLFSHSNFWGIILGNSCLITENEITLDSAYFSLIFSGGIVSFIIFLKVYARFIKNSFEQKDWLLLSVIVTYLCYGIMESVFTNILLFPNLVIWILILQAKSVPHKKNIYLKSLIFKLKKSYLEDNDL